MFHVGELIVYSAHGICQIDDICDKTFAGETKTYYVLRPLEEPNLTISIPTDYKTDKVLELMDKDDAEQILQSFEQPGMEWIENGNQRALQYQEIINQGNREKIADIVNTLLKRKQDVEQLGKKLGQADLRILSSVQSILFSELAISLNTTVETIEQRIMSKIKLS